VVMLKLRPAGGPRLQPPSTPRRPLSPYAILLPPNNQLRIIIKKRSRFVKVKPGVPGLSPDHRAPDPANHPMIRKIGGIAIYADK
jgi:hypothetical protein